MIDTADSYTYKEEKAIVDRSILEGSEAIELFTVALRNTNTATLTNGI